MVSRSGAKAVRRVTQRGMKQPSGHHLMCRVTDHPTARTGATRRTRIGHPPDPPASDDKHSKPCSERQRSLVPATQACPNPDRDGTHLSTRGSTLPLEGQDHPGCGAGPHVPGNEPGRASLKSSRDVVVLVVVAAVVVFFSCPLERRRGCLPRFAFARCALRFARTRRGLKHSRFRGLPRTRRAGTRAVPKTTCLKRPPW